MKKILIVSKAFYPNLSPRANRTSQLALEFVRLGYDTTVLLPDLDVSFYKQYSEETKIKFQNLGVTKFKPFSGDGLISRILNRLLLLLFEYPDIELAWMVNKALKKVTNFDLLITIAVPHPNHWGAAQVRKKKKGYKVWVADCGDPYMGCRTDTFEKLFYFKYIEKDWCRKCDYIAIPEESTKYAFYDEFHPKIRIIPQGFNLDAVIIPAYTKNPIPTFAYAGGLALHYRNPVPFLEFLSTLDIDFKFVMYTQSSIPESFRNKLGNKLVLLDYIPRSELLVVLSKMDFVVNFENNTSVQVPSKLIDYSIINRPVLSINSQLNSDLIMQFMYGDYSNKYKLPDLARYDIKNVASQFIDLIS